MKKKISASLRSSCKGSRRDGRRAGRRAGRRLSPAARLEPMQLSTRSQHYITTLHHTTSLPPDTLQPLHHKDRVGCPLAGGERGGFGGVGEGAQAALPCPGFG